MRFAIPGRRGRGTITTRRRSRQASRPALWPVSPLRADERPSWDPDRGDWVPPSRQRGSR